MGLKLSSTAKIAIGVVLLVIIGISVAFVLPLISESPAAVLNAEYGDVKLNDRLATNGTQLKANDVIATGQGQASVVFFVSSVVRIAENTRISLSQLQKEKADREEGIHQDSGRVGS